MSNPQPLNEPQARAQARAWLARQHSDAYELAVTLLHYVPEADRIRALRRLSTGELRRLTRLWPMPPTCARSPAPSWPTSSATWVPGRRRTVRNTAPAQASRALRSDGRHSEPNGS